MTVDEFFKDSESPKYAKVGIYGNAGSGKTRTAIEIAIGMIEDKGLEKVVAFFDTERGSDWVKPLLEKHGIKCLVKKSRSFKDLIQAGEIVKENNIPIMIVDSITHVWRELIAAFVGQRNTERYKDLCEKYGKEYADKKFKRTNKLEFQDWGVVKPMWERFTDFFLSSPVNVIVCGREGDIYEYEEKENGKKELIKQGSKMATEKELSYEPSLLINMDRRTVNGRNEIFAVVEKDRADMINGNEFPFPTYQSFKPHFDTIVVDGELKPFSGNMSNDLFEGSVIDPENEFKAEKRRREIAVEKINAILDRNIKGKRSEEGSIKRLEVIESVFRTTSKTEIENMPAYALEQGLEKLKFMFQETDNNNK